jgi:hypothetical protein
MPALVSSPSILRWALPLVLLLACGDDAPQSTTPLPSSTPSTATVTATSTSRARSADPWSFLPTVMTTFPDKEVPKTIGSILEARQAARKVEDQRIKRALIDVEAQLTLACQGPSLDAAFQTYQTVEAESLKADREALKEVLTAATADGRKMIWDVAAPEELLIESRSRMSAEASTNLPNWGTRDTDQAKLIAARRTILGLKLTIEATALDTSAVLMSQSEVIKNLDAEAETTPEATIAALDAIDQAMLQGQQIRFVKLQPACAGVDPQQWLSLLDQGSIEKFIGNLGGTAGIATPTTKEGESKGSKSGGKAENSGQGGMTAQGGQGQGGQGQGQGGQSQGGQGGQGQSGMSGQGGQGQGGMSGQGGQGGQSQGGQGQGGMSGQSGQSQGGQGQGGMSGQGGQSQGGQGQGGMSGQGGQSQGGQGQGGMSGQGGQGQSGQGAKGGQQGGQQGGQGSKSGQQGGQGNNQGGQPR